MSDEPLHMSIRARNERLHATLLGMGLHVDVVRSEADPDTIEYLIVSAGFLPKTTEDPPDYSHAIDGVKVVRLAK